MNRVTDKYIQARDIATTLFEWDWEALSETHLYMALYEQGYDWNGTRWVAE